MTDQEDQPHPWIFVRDYDSARDAAFVCLFAQETLARLTVPTTITHLSSGNHHYAAVVCTVTPNEEQQDLIARSMDFLMNDEVDVAELPSEVVPDLEYLHSAFNGPKVLGELPSKE